MRDTDNQYRCISDTHASQYDCISKTLQTDSGTREMALKRNADSFNDNCKIS